MTGDERCDHGRVARIPRGHCQAWTWRGRARGIVHERRDFVPAIQGESNDDPTRPPRRPRDEQPHL